MFISEPFLAAFDNNFRHGNNRDLLRSPLSFDIDSRLRKWKTSDILFKQFVRE